MKHSPLMLILMFALLFASCEKIDLSEGDGEGNGSHNVASSKSYKVAVMTRASSAVSDIRYPITVKAIDAEGVPSTDEARLLKSVWNTSTISTLNSVVASAGGKNIELYEGTDNARYLCEDATHTFSFVTSSSITAAGKTVKTYRLRLVKRVKFVIS